MIRFAIVAFLIAHGIVHVAVYDTPNQERRPAPFDPSQSWALAAGHVDRATARAASEALGLCVAIVFALAGWLLAFDVESWRGVAALGASLGLALKALWFHPWLSLGVVLDATVLLAVLSGWPASV